MASEFRHNKRRNTGLVYEFLARRLTTQVVDNDRQAAAKTLSMLKTYFSPGTPLAEERELFELIIATRGVSEQMARRILGEIQTAARRIDPRKLDIKKSNLIKEINYSFGRDFFNVHRVPEYRLLASIQLFLDSCRGASRISENVGKIRLEEGLVKYMMSSTPAGSSQPQNEGKIDDLVCTMAMQRFNEKYGRTLNNNQKRLIASYSMSMLKEDLSYVRHQMSKDRLDIFDRLKANANIKELAEDKIMMERFTEAQDRLAKMDVQNVTPEKVEEMMLYWKLVEEVSSDE